ncbi:hypothetical protein [Clostridium sporogenes]|nr:hypothetical protein [Clostridium sporogenes]
MGDTIKELVLSKWVLLYPDSLSCIFDEIKKKLYSLLKNMMKSICNINVL